MNLSLLNEACAQANLVAAWRVHTNPRVGCAIQTKAGSIFFGVHESFGGAHAEVNAIREAKLAGADLKGSTFYVTLEPCSHFGKTPPCTKALIDEGIAKVVVGALDPFENRAGLGLKTLEQSGIETQLIDHALSRELNKAWFFAHKNQRPYVLLKIATTLDGFFALQDGTSQFITGDLSRHSVHQLRSEVQGILTSEKTVLRDNPAFTIRLPDYQGPQPKVFIVPSQQSRDLKDSQLFHHDKSRVFLLSAQLSLEEQLKNLFQEHRIYSLMIEAGPTLSHSVLAQPHLVQELHHYMAPKYFGSGLGFSKKFLFEGLQGLRGRNSEVVKFEDGDFLVKSHFSNHN